MTLAMNVLIFFRSIAFGLFLILSFCGSAVPQSYHWIANAALADELLIPDSPTTYKRPFREEAVVKLLGPHSVINGQYTLILIRDYLKSQAFDANRVLKLSVQIERPVCDRAVRIDGKSVVARLSIASPAWLHMARGAVSTDVSGQFVLQCDGGSIRAIQVDASFSTMSLDDRTRGTLVIKGAVPLRELMLEQLTPWLGRAGEFSSLSWSPSEEDLRNAIVSESLILSSCTWHAADARQVCELPQLRIGDGPRLR